jgi:hypothetical protein
MECDTVYSGRYQRFRLTSCFHIHFCPSPNLSWWQRFPPKCCYPPTNYTASTNQAGSGGNTSDIYLESVQFESRPGNQYSERFLRRFPAYGQANDGSSQNLATTTPLHILSSSSFANYTTSRFYRILATDSNVIYP